MKRRITISTLIILLIALIIWCISRWDVWFDNPEEAPYEVSAVPTRVLLTFGDEDGMTSRNISWMCGSVVKPSYVEIKLLTDSVQATQRIEATGEVFVSRSGQAAYYVAKLRHLEEGGTYQYRVCTEGRTSDWHAFRLAKADEQETQFLFMGDIQDSIGGIANELLKRAIFRNPRTEFLVSGGDLTERPTDAYWAETFETLDSVGQAMPILTITGNHDYLKGIVGKLERRFSLIHSYFLDSMEGENQVFTVNYKNVQLFCLDSNREFFYLSTQREWLEKRLKASTAKWKIVVLHHPLYSIRGNMNNLIQRWMFDDLIREYGVDLVLQGHEHAYARMTWHDEDGTATTPIYTVSHCSPKNYRIEFDERFDKFGSGSRYYQTVKTHGDTLFLTTTDAIHEEKYDSLLIIKHGHLSSLRDAGRDIPEKIRFTPHLNNKKDKAFAERIKEYKQRKHIDN
ncbi:MAG: serine/threonine protein phosphatase [Bacteroidales bacterium]|nr:serine/threonine protein phosphatase [Bacteroidales bacterium]